MMTLLKISILILVLWTNELFADGPPIDSTGKIYVKYVSITLDSTQIAHLQKNRYLKLTPEQQKRLYFLNLPTYVDILDPFHNLCTCGQIYGMWYETNKIAFEITDTTKIQKWAADDDIYNGYNKDRKAGYSKNKLFIGTNGQLFYKGETLDINKVSQLIKKLRLEKKSLDYIEIFQPPTIGNINNNIISSVKKTLRQNIPSDFKVFWM